MTCTSIWQQYRLVIFQNFPNTTRCFAARGILVKFEISLAVLLPNTTTSHAITYTYLIVLFHSAFLVRLTENVTMAVAANGKLCELLTWIQEEMQ